MTKFSVAVIGVAKNSMTNILLKELLNISNVEIKFFIDATISTEKSQKLYNYKKFSLLSFKKWLNFPYRIKYNNLSLCNKNKITIIFPNHNDINEGIDSKYFDREIDYILILGCDHILKEHIINWPKRAVINYHYSILPSYRGKNGIFWQWYNEEPHMGCTYHKINTEIDKGEIILQEIIKYNKNDSLKKITSHVVSQGAKQLKNLFELLEKDESKVFSPKPLNSYYPTKRYHNVFKIKYNESLKEIKKKINKLKYVQLENGLKLTKVRVINQCTLKDIQVSLNYIVVPFKFFNLKVYTINNIPAIFYYLNLKKFVELNKQ